MEKSISFLDDHNILYEKECNPDDRELDLLLSFCRISRNSDHSLTLELSPLEVWNSVFTETDLDKYLAELADYLKTPIPGNFHAELKREREHARQLIQTVKDNDRTMLRGEKHQSAVKVRTSIEPRGGQTAALAAARGDTGFRSGILVLPGGYGKTFLGLMLMRESSLKTIILCHTTISCRQWRDELCSKGGLQKKNITLSPSVNKPLSILTYTDFYKLPESTPVSHLLIDEVHHIDEKLLNRLKLFPSALKTGLTATYQFKNSVRERVFTEIGPRLFRLDERSGKDSLVKKVNYMELSVELPPTERRVYYQSRSKQTQFKIASTNPRKGELVSGILKKFPGRKCIIFGEYLEQLKEISKATGLDLISSKTGTAGRCKVYQAFNQGKINCFITSRISNEEIDLPSASLIIQVSGKFGDSVEEAQRLGRLLREKDEAVHYFSLVSKNTVEVNYSLDRKIMLVKKGYDYHKIESLTDI